MREPDFRILRLHDREQVGGQVLLEDVFVVPHGCVLAPFAFGDDGRLALAAHCRLEVHPPAMELGRDVTGFGGIAAAAQHFVLQLRRADSFVWPFGTAR